MIASYLNQTITYLQKMPAQDIEAVVDVLKQARSKGNTVFVIGNGGSASTASHCACDLSKNTIQSGLPRIKCVALTDSLPTITAYANDFDYSSIFVEQLKNLAQSSDALIGFSGSGNSPNVVKAMEWAKENGLTVIAIGGRDGGKMKNLADISIIAPTDVMAQIEDAHLTIKHIIAVSLVGELRPPLK